MKRIGSACRDDPTSGETLSRRPLLRHSSSVVRVERASLEAPEDEVIYRTVNEFPDDETNPDCACACQQDAQSYPAPAVLEEGVGKPQIVPARIIQVNTAVLTRLEPTLAVVLTWRRKPARMSFP